MRKIVIIFSIAVSKLFSQDLQFLNANQSLVYLNPSFAGSNGNLRIQFSYLNQRPRGMFVKNQPNDVTYLNTFDIYLHKLKAGLAFSALLDNQQNSSFIENIYHITYAQYLGKRNGNLKIIPSVQFGYGFTQRWPGKVDYYNRYTGVILSVQPEATQKNYFNLNAGIMLSYRDKLFAGASLDHINRPDRGIYQEELIPRLLNVHLSYNETFSETNVLQLYYRFRSQDTITTHQAGFNFILLNHFVCGFAASLRNSLLVNL